MFIGSFYHSLQAKGRLAIPARFRSNLGEQPILTRGLDSCLQLLPFDIWSKLTQTLGNNPLEPQKQRQLRRWLANAATQAEFDNQGRILIPKNLRETAHLTKKVVITGSLDWVEIWDVETYHQHLDQVEANSQDLVEQINSSGDQHD